MPDSWFSKMTPREDLLSPQPAPVDGDPSDIFVLFTKYDAIYKINKIKHDVYITPCHFESRMPAHRAVG